MRLIKGPVPNLPYPPKACAVTNRIDGDVIDMQTVIDRPEPTRLYLRREVVEKAAQLCDMVPRSEVEELREQLQSLTERFEELRETSNLTDQLESHLERSAA